MRQLVACGPPFARFAAVAALLPNSPQLCLVFSARAPRTGRPPSSVRSSASASSSTRRRRSSRSGRGTRRWWRPSSTGGRILTFGTGCDQRPPSSPCTADIGKRKQAGHMIGRCGGRPTEEQDPVAPSLLAVVAWPLQDGNRAIHKAAYTDNRIGVLSMLLKRDVSIDARGEVRTQLRMMSDRFFIYVSLAALLALPGCPSRPHLLQRPA